MLRNLLAGQMALRGLGIGRPRLRIALAAYLLQDASDSPPPVPAWLQICGVIATIVIGLLTLRVSSATAKITARKTELESIKLERELGLDNGAQFRQGEAGSKELGSSAQSRLLNSVKVQGYIVRFIILSLSQLFWNVFTQGFSLLVSGGVASFYALGTGASSRYLNLVGIIPAVLGWLVTLLILLTIGLPLLKDILSDMGVQFSLMWLRDVARRKDEVAG